MLKLHLTTHTKNDGTAPTVFIFAGENLLTALPSGMSSNLTIDSQVTDLILTDGQMQQQISVAEIKAAKQTAITLTDDLSIQLRWSNQIHLFDYINVILASLSAIIAIGFSFFSNTNWSECLFLLGSTILVVLFFMFLYGHPINARNYNIRMYASIGALILIFILIPLEHWKLKTIIGLSTLTVITRFIKDYQRSLSVVYNPFAKQ